MAFHHNSGWPPHKKEGDANPLKMRLPPSGRNTLRQPLFIFNDVQTAAVPVVCAWPPSHVRAFSGVTLHLHINIEPVVLEPDLVQISQLGLRPAVDFKHFAIYFHGLKTLMLDCFLYCKDSYIISYIKISIQKNIFLIIFFSILLYIHFSMFYFIFFSILLNIFFLILFSIYLNIHLYIYNCIFLCI